MLRRPHRLARLLGIGTHRAKLVDRKEIAVLAQPHLAQDDGTLGLLHEQCEQREEG